MCCYCSVCGQVQYYFLELNSWNLLTSALRVICCAASKSKARSEGPSRPAGPERSGIFAFAQLRAETSENHLRRRRKKHRNAESDVFGLLAGHRFDQQGEKGTRRFEEHFNIWIACNKASRHNLDSPSRVDLLNAS